MTFYSQQNEDRILYEKVLNYRDGFFIELGAMDGVTFSNTLFFEKELEWSGVLIEPSPTLFEALQQNRSKCFTFNYAITENRGHVEFIDAYAVGGVISAMSEKHKNAWNLNDRTTCLVSSLPICDILSNIAIKKVDLFSIDVEGAEFEVLNTFDWSIPVHVVVIELDGHTEEKDAKCRTLLAEKGFTFDSNLGNNDIWINKNFHTL